jgi:hypothetical protein
MDKPAAKHFTTVTDMRAIPADKIDHFCEDLRLWLHMHAHIAAVAAEVGNEMLLKVLTPTESFGWIDDGRHDANINVTINGWLKAPDEQAVAKDSDGS